MRIDGFVWWFYMHVPVYALKGTEIAQRYTQALTHINRCAPTLTHLVRVTGIRQTIDSERIFRSLFFFVADGNETFYFFFFFC